MINLGIVIAISEYSGGASNLPACRRDGRAISKILETESRFDEVLFVDGDTRSSIVKPRVIDFFTKHKGKEIGDLVFYFTGHGDFHGDDFYYLLSDFDSKRRKQTSIENSELDDLVRNLSPKLFVKIVDACHSGVSYIKSADEFKDYLKGATGRFTKLYFMFSSQSEQFSYQDEHLSYFTRRLVEAIASHQASSIRYKDVIDFISDSFEGDAAQTPFFVIQADLTETFCEISVSLKNGIAEFLTSPTAGATLSQDHIQPESIVDLIKKDAQLYCTEQEVLDILQTLSGMFQNRQVSNDLEELYTFGIHEVNSHTVRNAVAIGRWFDQNKDDRRRYFVAVIRESREFSRKIQRNLFDVALGIRRSQVGDEDLKTITETREVVTGYKSTVDLPYSYLNLFATPKYPNINPGSCYVVPIVSMTHLRLFWASSLYDHVGWDNSRPIGPLEWATDEVLLRERDKIERLMDQIFLTFVAFVEAPIKANWSPPQEINLQVAPASDTEARSEDSPKLE